MPTKRLIKHNPTFLTEDELAEVFVVREAELRMLLRIIGENTGPSNQHVLVIGARGMGKTMLVRRCALAVEKDETLSRLWQPVLFPEEVYSVSSEGEFWLAAMKCIADKESDPRWRERFDALRRERDERRLRTLALAALSEYSDTLGRRLLVVVENFQMLWGEQATSANAWDLRHTMSNEPKIMLLATAVTRFEEIDHADKANFELFREIGLGPLNSLDCRKLWSKVAGEELNERQIRPIEILTGGSPRLLAILADFAAGRSLSELLDDLVVLIDDHTTYFKANVEALPPAERRVFVTLAEIWDPAEARRVAECCRLDVNTVSAQLSRLMDRGAVQEVGKKGRAKLYQITERLYNIYHLMRLSGSEANRVKAFVRLLVPVYGEEKVAVALAGEACRFDGARRMELIAGYKETLSFGRDSDDCLRRILHATPQEFFDLPEANGLTETFDEMLGKAKEGRKEEAGEVRSDEDAKAAQAVISEVLELMKQNRFEEAIAVCDDVDARFYSREEITLQTIVALAGLGKGISLIKTGRLDEAIALFNKVEARFGNHEETVLLAIVLQVLLGKGIALRLAGRFEEEIAVFDKVVARFGSREEIILLRMLAEILVFKGVALGKAGRFDEATAVFDEVVARFGSREETALLELVVQAMFNKGFALRQAGHIDEATAVFDEVVARFGSREETALLEPVAKVMINKGVALGKAGRFDQAIAFFDEVVTRIGGRQETGLLMVFAMALNNKAWAIFQKGDQALATEAIGLAERALELQPEENLSRHTLASALGLAKRWPEAFAQARVFSDDTRIIADAPNDIISFFIFAAAHGQAREALKALAGTRTEKEMEPLVVALQMAGGLEFRAPQEIVEVAKDIVEQIEAAKAKKAE